MLLNWVFKLGVGSNALITRNMSFGSMYSGVIKGDSGGNSKEEAIRVGITSKGSYFSVYEKVVLKLGGSSNVCIFLIYPSRSKSSTPKGSQHVCTGS